MAGAENEAVAEALCESSASRQMRGIERGHLVSLRVCVAGASGWVGRPLCREVAAAPDLDLVGAVAPSQRGRRLGEVLDVSGLDVVVSGSVAEALRTPTDVLVDYTAAQVAKENALTAIGKGVSIVIGTLGPDGRGL